VTFHAGPLLYDYLWSNGSTANEITVGQTGNYWVNVSNQCGTVKDTVSLDQLYQLPYVALGAGGSFCEDSLVTLDAGNPGSTYVWTTGETTQTIVPQSTGNYGVNVTDAHNCSSSVVTAIEIVRLPHVTFDPEVWLCPGEQLVLDAKTDYGNYMWQDGSGNAQYVATQPGIYWVQVNNFCGSGGDTIVVGVYDCQCEFYVPNAFTPNADGKNEAFLPLTACSIETYDLKIYNRWGIMIFESVDLAAGWDGNYNGSQAPEAVYNYLITYTGHANTHHVSDRLTGSVTLVR
jgi:gliding motility-associated-like protein